MIRAKTNGELVAADAAKQLGIKLTTSGLANFAALIDVTGTIVPGSPVMVGDVPVVDWMAAQLASSPTWMEKPAAKEKSEPETETMTERGLRINSERRTDAGKAAAAAKLVADHGNPFQPGRTFNRAHAGFVANHAPELADRLRAEVAL